MESILPVVVQSTFFGVFLVVFLWSGVWVYRDAQRRGKPPWLVAALVLLVSWPISLAVWLVLGPEPPNRPPFNLDDYRVR
jgi:hypothetical protein